MGRWIGNIYLWCLWSVIENAASAASGASARTSLGPIDNLYALTSWRSSQISTTIDCQGAKQKTRSSIHLQCFTSRGLAITALLAVHQVSAKIPIKFTFFSFYHSNNLTSEERENAHELTNLISQLGYEAPILSEEKNSLDLEQKRYEMKIAEEKRVWVHTTRKQVQKYRFIKSR